MAGKKIKSIQGTEDVLPEQWLWWRRLADAARTEFELAGYREIRTPVIENVDLFIKGTGATTDIVEKEMYVIPQERGSGIALRPEGTPAVIRAYLEHSMFSVRKFRKLYYLGPMFRRERPQKGRLRQFHQLGVEAIGTLSPLLDAETILLAVKVYRRLGLTRFSVVVNSIGCENCRPAFRAAVKERLESRRAQLCPLCQARLDRNVFRVLDCKEERCRALCADLPHMDEFLCDECSPHYAQVKAALAVAGVDFAEDPYLVRGLDYYTKTVYEIKHDSLGARSTICGGGRYDTLVESLSGPPTPCVGFAMGAEATLLALEAELGAAAEQIEPGPDAFIVTFCDEAQAVAFDLVARLRAAGIAADMDYEGRSGKAQMRAANKLGAKAVLILGESELQSGAVSLKNMLDGEQTAVPNDQIVARMKDMVASAVKNETSSQSPAREGSINR